MAEYTMIMRGATEHHHRGKSSESLIDTRQILAGLSVNPGQIVLDAGCGNGYMAKALAQQTGSTGKVYAIDLDGQAMHALAAETAGLNIEVITGDITRKTKLAAGAFDLIYMSNVMHGFSMIQAEGFRREANRLLKPGGRLAIVEIRKEETPFGPPYEIRFSPEALHKATGLRPYRLIDLGGYFYMYIFKTRPAAGEIRPARAALNAAS